MNRKQVLFVLVAVALLATLGFVRPSFSELKEGEMYLTVDYDRPLKKAIGEGGYYYSAPGVTDENFPAKATGPKKVIAKPFRFGKRMTSSQAREHIVRAGYRVGGMYELVALDEQYPNLQSQIEVIELQDAWYDASTDCHRVGAIWDRGGLGLKNLHLYHDAKVDGWDGHEHFLAIREISQ